MIFLLLSITTLNATIMWDKSRAGEGKSKTMIQEGEGERDGGGEGGAFEEL